MRNSIYTEEESIEGLKKAILDAVKCHFEENKMPCMAKFKHGRKNSCI